MNGIKNRLEKRGHFWPAIALLVVFAPSMLRAQPQQQLSRHVPEILSQLTPVGRVRPDTKIDLIIGLQPRNQDQLDRMLRDLYDPASPNYRQFITPSRYAEQFGPTQETYNSLIAFAERQGFDVVLTQPNRQAMHVRASADAIERAFQITLKQYKEPASERVFYAPDREPTFEPDLPPIHITGLDNLHPPRRAPNLYPYKRSSGEIQKAGGSGPDGAYTGSDFRAAYAPGVNLNGAGQTVGILELEGYDSADINSYELASGFPNVPLQNVYLDGFTGGSKGAESTADIEFVISMAPGLSHVTIYGASYGNAQVHDLLAEMANPSHGEPFPYQLSTSYYFFYDPTVYADLKQLAVQGQTLFVASGDFGSYNETTGSGAFPPVDHPLVTSVGGTILSTSGPRGNWTAEMCISFSGGGYSPWGGDPQFAIPWWQAGMDFTTNHGSKTVRNAPDVSMVATDISFFFQGSWQGFAGTSASAPLWAGFMALVSQQAAASGRPRIGFANPALYAVGRSSSYASAFHDITTGNNFNATNPDRYSAVAGYDLCSGWGTPVGSALINALVGLQTGWGKVPGGGTTAVADAATVFQDRLYLFGIGIGDRRHYVNTFDGTSWSGWRQVPGGGTTILSDAATVFNNRIYLFGVGTGDHRHYVNTFDGTSWSGWQQVPGGGTTAVADAATAFNGRLYLFGMGINDHKHYVNSFNGTQWSGWGAVPGGGTAVLSDAATVFKNRLYLFAVGINDHKHYINTFDGTTWSGWSLVPGGGTTMLADAAVALNDHLSLFAIGINDHKHYRNRFDGMTWSGWHEVPGSGTTQLPDAA